MSLQAGVRPSGSSPRMWGTDSNKSTINRRERFIPTHVGNGVLALLKIKAPPVHPHACGERVRVSLSFTVQSGSSPRMWGTVVQIRSCCFGFRFIPTHVGNGYYDSKRRSVNAVHPHACGERASTSASPSPDSGSSPRMWGTGRFWHDPGAKWRFIPTHVGNGLTTGVSARPKTVHPHACGERNT